MPDLPGLPWRRTEFWIRQALRGLEVGGKTVLDVGAGEGLFTCYMALQGAHRVVALEPESSGSGRVPRRVLLERVRALRLTNVTCRADTFQSFDAGADRFDVLLAHNVINHLDEAAVQVLATSPDARAEYARLLRKMHDLLRPGGLAIIADCARDNFFAHLGVRNPLAPTIQWHKHQNPPIWCALLVEAGFAPPALHWTYPRRLRALGWLFAMPGAAYMMDSHFVLHATRPAAAPAAVAG